MWTLLPSRVSRWPPIILKWGLCWLPISFSCRKSWCMCWFDSSQSWYCSLEGTLVIARHENGDVAQLVRASDRHAADAGSIPRCGKEFFFQSQRSVKTLLCVSVTPCSIACINICARVKDPVVHVRVRWIMETLKYPAWTVSWLGEIPLGQYSCKK